LTATDHNYRAAAALIRVRARTSGSRTDLAVTGEVDLASVDVLRSAVFAALEAGATELVIDLSETEFIDSAGLHLLVDTEREVDRLRGRLAIVCPPGPMRRVFDITGLAAMLPLHDDVARV
jgi:anti-sigma B factor antagonist